MQSGVQSHTIQQTYREAIEHHRAGRLPQAEALYRQILSQDPNHADANGMLGVIAAQVGRHADAETLFARAITLNPNVPESYSNLGATLRELKRPREAIAVLIRAIKLRPNYPEAHYNLGNALKEAGDIPKAMAAYRQAIAQRPNYAEAHYNLANLLREADKVDEAIAAYRQAISFNPSYAEAHINLGVALLLQPESSFDEVIACFRKALALDPKNRVALFDLANALKDSGQLDDALAIYRQLASGASGQRDSHSLLHVIHYHPDYDPQRIWQEHVRWNEQHARPLAPAVLHHSNDPSPDRRLRIGYVSPDLHEHPVGRFVLPLLSKHDHEQFEVFCYSDVPRGDAMTDRIRQHADVWRDMHNQRDEQLIRQIRDDQIDVLVDLTSHTADNRLLVFARKPAPVQVTYLAYCSTTGLDTMDYRLTDAYLDPPELDDRWYSEKSVRLRSYWCYQPPELGDTETVRPLGAGGRITFGCLNNYCKVTPATLEMWARLLAQVPDSRLLVYSPPGSHREVAQKMLTEADVDPNRLQFVLRVSPRQYFEQYRQIDIALDPFPYGGGTTTCDALWMGVPVVSLAGQTAVSRAGLSILSNIGLPELVAHTPEQYVQIAADLARDLPRLQQIRAGLRTRMQSSPLMDAAGFARELEQAYRQIWQRWCHRTTERD